jgi:hypothetical protein
MPVKLRAKIQRADSWIVAVYDKKVALLQEDIGLPNDLAVSSPKCNSAA